MARVFSALRLRELMDAQEPKRLSAKGLAARIRHANPHLPRCQHQHVEAWLQRGVVPGAAYLSACAQALGTTMDALYEEEAGTDILTDILEARGVPETFG